MPWPLDDPWPSLTTVSRGINDWQLLAPSFGEIRSGIGFKHWKRVDGSKCAHCLQQCNSAPHFGHFPFQSTSPCSAVEQLKQRAATTFCSRRGRRGPVTSRGGRGPEGLGRSGKPRSFESRSESLYPRCRYLRSSSMRQIDSWSGSNAAPVTVEPLRWSRCDGANTSWLSM